MEMEEDEIRTPLPTPEIVIYKITKWSKSGCFCVDLF